MAKDLRCSKTAVLCTIFVAVFMGYPGDKAKATTLSVGMGLRSDDLQWSIAGTQAGTNPNILSELTWRDVDMLQLELSAEGAINSHWILGANWTYGVAYDGEVQDSDYLGNNRTMEFSRSLSNADDSYAMDYGLWFGYVIQPGAEDTSGGFTVMPLFGITHKESKMKMTDGVQVLSDYGFPVPLGPFSGLNSTYHGEWDGIWLGARFAFESSGGRQFYVEFQHHSADYGAQANWNLRPDLRHPVSFTHDTDAEGNVAILAWQSKNPEGNGWEVKLRHEEWDSESGMHTVYFSNGSMTRTQLNEVVTESTSLVWRRIWAF